MSYLRGNRNNSGRKCGNVVYGAPVPMSMGAIVLNFMEDSAVAVQKQQQAGGVPMSDEVAVACFGVLCPKHEKCQKYENVETTTTRLWQTTCDTAHNGTFGGFVPLPDANNEA